MMSWPHLKVFLFTYSTEHSKRKMKKEVDRRTGGKAILKSGQEWTLPLLVVG